MRILIEPSSISCLNVGDVAMLQVAVGRLRAAWPGAEIHIVTSAPDLLAQYCPQSAPVDVADRMAWMQGRTLPGVVERRLPGWLAAPASTLQRAMWRRMPALTNWQLRWRLKAAGAPHPRPRSFYDLLVSSDLFFLCGMGGINDAFHDSATGLLEIMGIAVRHGVPAVALGQGIGPLELPALRSLARQILPRLKVIALREKREGPGLLRQLGAPENRTFVTGDDAIELVYSLRPADLGRDIGVNVRLSQSSGLDPAILDTIRTALNLVAADLGVALRAVPISSNRADSDVATLERLRAAGLGPFAGRLDLTTPADVIRSAGQCRVVVTASYHGAVFALAQGVSAICLVASAYYADKLLGVQDQFQTGCRVLRTDQPGFAAALVESLREVWREAPAARDTLLAKAEEQMEAGRQVYGRLPELLR
jgi:colanic acid/amylovoran biosynthesis protein